ncbi:ProQ/FINO family protein [Rhizobium sp. Rhizsp82]|uniref:ProQ/FINO family protein n=1 Tax=Rhizobium sp. Rhizsp82 TaxID=3243057 RepID=UPI0039B48F32
MNEPWTASRGPIEATELEVQRAEAIQDLLTRRIGILAQKPGDSIRPFAIGLFEQIKLLRKPEHSISKLRRATASYVHSKRYYVASAQPDALRHDLDGAAVGLVSEEDRLAAQRSFFALKEAHDGKPEKQVKTRKGRVDLEVEPTKDGRIRAGLLPRKRG